MKDDLGVPLRKARNGHFVAYVVMTPYGCETTFASKQKALRDHAYNKKHKVPSYVAVFEYWGSQVDCVDALASYRRDEI